MISTQELIDWVKECHPSYVSIHAFDSRYKNFIRHIAKSDNTSVFLVYIVKDHHLHPITNEINQIGCCKIWPRGE